MFAAHRSTWYSNDTRGIGTADFTFYIILPAIFSLAFFFVFQLHASPAEKHHYHTAALAKIMVYHEGKMHLSA